MSSQIYQLLKICFEKKYAVCDKTSEELSKNCNLYNLNIIKCFDKINIENIEEFLNLIKDLSNKLNIKFNINLSLDQIVADSKIEDHNLLITIKNDIDNYKLWSNKNFYILQSNQLSNYGLKCMKK